MTGAALSTALLPATDETKSTNAKGENALRERRTRRRFAQQTVIRSALVPSLNRFVYTEISCQAPD
jgi:hypothetical protein